MTPNQKRSIAAGLTMSLVAISGVISREGFTDHAVIPVPGDRPTYGNGSTFRPDGSPVRMGDTITRTAARTLAVRDLKNRYEAGIHRCADDLLLYQRQFDFLVDSAYNLGVSKVCKSLMVKEFRAGRYSEGCKQILRYNYFQGRDCRVKENKCGGIPKDRARAYRMCMGIV